MSVFIVFYIWRFGLFSSIPNSVIRDLPSAIDL